MIRVGVIGLGQMGILHAAIANSLPRSRTVAIADKDTRLTRIASKITPSIEYYEDYNQMLDAEELDALFVCTPVQTHLPILLDVERRAERVAVLVEKPLTASYADAKRVVEKFSRNDQVGMVGFQKRFAGTFRKAKEVLDAGALGRLFTFRGYHYVSENFGKGVNWKFEKNTGGATLEFAPHLLDMALWLFGEPDRFRAVRKKMFSSEVDDYLHAILEYKSGLLGHLDASWSMRNFKPAEFMIEIHGSNGTMNVNEDRIVTYLDSQVLDTFPAGTQVLPKSLLSSPVPILIANPENVLQDMYFLNHAERGEQAEPNFESAAKVNKLVDLVDVLD